ncbi:hypothetical protein B0G83_10644 [Paraburkholderia sp. BL21I4N1]|nr:hypothetical protein B0G83_10644 [Paraburkholderia sp. BL21I4N1]
MAFHCASAAAQIQQPPPSIRFDHIEAVRGDSALALPPSTGWLPVTLPDDWTSRWPDFNGVVWYRLDWQQTGTGQPVGLMFDYLNMAGAVYVNGSLVMRDASLVEPLTRAWNSPRYQLLPPPLLRVGTNTILIRVSGLAAYQPGLSPVYVGAPQVLKARYEHAYWLRQDLQLFSLAVTTTLGCFFFSLWLMRRKEVVYGWFSVMSVAWWWVAFNQIATSPWPFSSTDTWEGVNTIALLIYSAAFTMFIARFCERRLPRLETALWLLVGLGAVAMLAAPPRFQGTTRAFLVIAHSVNFFTTCLVFIVFAWRHGRTDQRILSFCIAAFVAAGLHDMLTFFGILETNIYFTAPVAQVQMITMALVLAWNFVANLRRIERFNDDLNIRVDQARTELTVNLRRQHDLEVANARLNERLNLAHDLHDGLGGTLVSNITALEYAPHDISPDRFLSVLKGMRDDLRIIIDAAANQQFGESSLAAQIGPLRHRLTQLFEQQSIACRWHVVDLEECYLPTSQTLDIMRILQEALANTLKHSRASRIDIDLRSNAHGLDLAVQDNGMGCDPGSPGFTPGAGMRSMRARTQRLGGTFSFESTPGSTMLSIHIPRTATT